MEIRLELCELSSMATDDVFAECHQYLGSFSSDEYLILQLKTAVDVNEKYTQRKHVVFN